MGEVDFSAIAGSVVRDLMGEPNVSLSTKDELRFGAKGSLSVELKSGIWYDHEAEEGGGLLDLIRRERPGEDARDWLAENGYVVGGAANKPNGGGSPENGASSDAAPPAAAAATRTTVFNYCDEGGRLLYQVVRVDAPGRPKKIRQRRPDGRGGFVWKLGEVRRVLYRLAELLAAPAGEAVYVFEGEGKAELAASWALVATCCVGGAGKWREEYNAFFAGKRVVIVPDNDTPGRRHADDVGRMLQGVAAEIRMLQLPDLPPKGDVVNWAMGGGTPGRFLELAAAAPPWVPSDWRPGLPRLVINKNDPTAAAKELAALIAARGDFLFNGNAPVRVAAEADCLPRALEVTNEALRVYAHEICNPVGPLSRDVAALYLNGLEGRWGLKHFRGITTAPILADDGTIRAAAGYDAATGLWCHNVPGINVADAPTRADADAALRRLRSFFRTFPFADGARATDECGGGDVVDQGEPPGLDESSFLAALMTAVCRSSLDLAPGFLCDAPAYSGSGTGKGLLVKSICIIASGVRPSALTGGHSAEEFDKRLTSALVEAHPAVFLDNFNSKELRSDILASALTENPAIVRVLGQTKNVPLHTKTFVGITGNGVQVAEDMARRLLNARIDAKMEDPEQRKFAPGFLDRVLAERPRLLSDALTIWRWGRLTRPEPGRPLGSYEVWSQWCRDPLVALGARDPVDRTAEIKEADPRRQALIAVFSVWWGCHGTKEVKASELNDSVVAWIDTHAKREGGGELKYSPQRVRRWLAQHAGTRVGGYSLNKVGSDGAPSKQVAIYKLESTSDAAGKAGAAELPF